MCNMKCSIIKYWEYELLQCGNAWRVFTVYSLSIGLFLALINNMYISQLIPDLSVIDAYQHPMLAHVGLFQLLYLHDRLVG